ncbi:VOC family protein [Nakamurella flavida]|uniref:VOC family protein n=1 Tax=Nakamurella flavida TaxID=363630 RepID=A0A938YN21_9ACTN|nr:VOC family protein [Nakamurella flavida]MBM9476382.1 VOC family protein [Nakamurella flavida]MDP9779518.1 putative glyoxalase superfamily protein PhnB [Nakamurella flavida]
MPVTLSLFTLYRDPAAAVRWLVEAFGFEVVARFGAEDGSVAHAELRLGDAVVMVQAADGHAPAPLVGTSTSRAPVLTLDDDAAVDELFARVERAGATVLIPPETTEWGNHRFEVLDPEGHQWSVGTHRPGAAW